jgi:hypothetical protein
MARRGIESSQRLERHRWRVERALSWLSWDRRLQVRWDRGSDRFLAFVLLAWALVCCKRLSQQQAGTNAYLVPVTQTAWFSSRTRPPAVV